MLMIVLDATVVNVALPSIQEDLGFAQASLAWVVNAYLIAFGGLLLLAGRLGDLVSRPRDLPRRARRLHGGLAGLRAGRSQEVLVGAASCRASAARWPSAVILGMIVTMFPSPGAGQGDRGLRLRGLRRAARSACWPAAS
jgi:MFS family permease